MYLDSEDFQTIWQLAHNWVGTDPDQTDPNAPLPELKDAIHRLMSAAYSRTISIRTRRFAVFMDESFFTLITDFPHYRKFWKCLRHDEFNKAYLDSIYVKRGDVLRWCQNEFLSPPPIWQLAEIENSPASRNANKEDEEEEDSSWYDVLTEKRKQKVACLEMARALWKINPKQTYAEIHQHPIMKMYCTPSVFSLRAFKKWSGRYASEYAKNGGRDTESRK
jgi:hypothetical protein